MRWHEISEKINAGRLLMKEAIQEAAEVIQEADTLVIAAGAGMGVDSGLPDFRGPQGFWRAYPPYEKLGLHFFELANPRWFREDPALAWGFYGHRFALYRRTTPHAGFSILKKWADRMPRGAFVFTSNVDGHFQLAGFDELQIVECHGSIHWLQCTSYCGSKPWQVPASVMSIIDLDEESMRAREPHPVCPKCGALARPNILMFGDARWDSSRTSEQERRLQRWMWDREDARMIIVECGAGTAVPTVRAFAEDTAEGHDTILIRISPREPQAPDGHFGLALGALEALEAIDRALAAG
jgi:NAD-dependent SIR2 family protein deacetylase